MATFASWLKTQSNRQDETGELSRYWDGVEHGKINSPSGVERFLRENGHCGEGSPVPGWLDVALAEYRATRGDLQVVTSAPPAAAPLTDYIPELRNLRDRLEAVSSMLVALCERLGVPLTTWILDQNQTVPAAGTLPGFPPSWAQPVTGPDAGQRAATAQATAAVMAADIEGMVARAAGRPPEDWRLMWSIGKDHLDAQEA